MTRRRFGLRFFVLKRFFGQKNPGKTGSCREPDSNRHDQCGQGILSPRCLPFHHLGGVKKDVCKIIKKQSHFQVCKFNFGFSFGCHSGMYVAFEPGSESRILVQNSSYSLRLVITQSIGSAYLCSFGMSAYPSVKTMRPSYIGCCSK